MWASSNRSWLWSGIDFGTFQINKNQHGQHHTKTLAPVNGETLRIINQQWTDILSVNTSVTIINFIYQKRIVEVRSNKNGHSTNTKSVDLLVIWLCWIPHYHHQLLEKVELLSITMLLFIIVNIPNCDHSVAINLSK